MDNGIEMEGSNLSGVTSLCSWEESSLDRSKDLDEDKENKGLHGRKSRNDNEKPRISKYGELNCNNIKIIYYLMFLFRL